MAIIVGTAGDDLLTGNDKLSGGTGADALVFDTALNGRANKDTLTDFASGSDRLRLDNDVFTAFSAATSSALPAGAWRSGPGARSAVDADDRLLCHTSTDALFYDADGTGPTAPVLFPQLGSTTHPVLTTQDIAIIF